MACPALRPTKLTSVRSTDRPGWLVHAQAKASDLAPLYALSGVMGLLASKPRFTGWMNG